MQSDASLHLDLSRQAPGVENEAAILRETAKAQLVHAIQWISQAASSRFCRA